MAGRRLPLYLVLDTSGSMVGDPIEATNMGIKMLVSELMGDPMAMETVFISIITFSNSAQQIIPLSELTGFQAPTLMAGGSTALGKALELLITSIDREVTKQTSSTKGDYKPLVFLMTDGQPTDSWEKSADKVKNKHWNVIACAAGARADESQLMKIADSVVKLNDCQAGTLKAFFKWVTQSAKIQSVRPSNVDAGPLTQDQLADTTSGILLLPAQ